MLPYEPYYKLKPSLLKLAVAQEPLPDDSALNLLLFADAREQTLADLDKPGRRGPRRRPVAVRAGGASAAAGREPAVAGGLARGAGGGDGGGAARRPMT